MTKERRAVSIDEDVDEYLDQPHVNASGLVNDLVKRHMNGDVEDGIREYRIRQLREEADEYETRAERKREQAEKLRELAEEQQDERREELSAVIDQLADAPRDPSNPAIKTKAKKVGLTPEELVDELPERDDGGEFRSL